MLFNDSWLVDTVHNIFYMRSVTPYGNYVVHELYIANNFKGAAQGRVVLIGNTEKLQDNNRKTELREKYMARHKGILLYEMSIKQA